MFFTWVWLNRYTGYLIQGNQDDINTSKASAKQQRQLRTIEEIDDSYSFLMQTIFAEDSLPFQLNRVSLRG